MLVHFLTNGSNRRPRQHARQHLVLQQRLDHAQVERTQRAAAAVIQRDGGREQGCADGTGRDKAQVESAQRAAAAASNVGSIRLCSYSTWVGLHLGGLGRL